MYKEAIKTSGGLPIKEDAHHMLIKWWEYSRFKIQSEKKRQRERETECDRVVTRTHAKHDSLAHNSKQFITTNPHLTNPSINFSHREDGEGNLLVFLCVPCTSRRTFARSDGVASTNGDRTTVLCRSVLLASRRHSIRAHVHIVLVVHLEDLLGYL